MSVPTLPVFQDGVLANAAELNAIVANVEALYEASMGVPAGGGYNTSKKPQVVLSIASATSACTTAHSNTSQIPGAVVWDTALLDTDAMWVSGSLITVNTAGTYYLSTQLAVNDPFGSAVGSGLQLYLMVNGTAYATNTVGCWRDYACTQARASATLSLLPATVIYVYALYAYTGTAARFFANTAGGCRFEAIRIGPA